MHHHLGCLVRGSQRTEEDLRECCSAFWDLASSCYGPHGRSKVLQAHEQAGASIVTSISSRIALGEDSRTKPQRHISLFQNFCDHPCTSLRSAGTNFQSLMASLLVRSTITAQHESFQDGGLLSIMIASRYAQNTADTPGLQRRGPRVLDASRPPIRCTARNTGAACCC